MDLIAAAYEVDDDDDDEAKGENSSTAESLARLSLPAIDAGSSLSLALLRSSSAAAVSSKHESGPTHPLLLLPPPPPTGRLQQRQRSSSSSSHAAPLSMNDALFAAQFHAEQQQQQRANGGASASERRKARQKLRRGEAKAAAAGSEGFQGPWADAAAASEEEEEEEEETVPAAAAAAMAPEESTAASASAAKEEEEEEGTKAPKAKRGKREAETTVLHLQETHDYQGRSFVEPPTEWRHIVAQQTEEDAASAERSSSRCFLPKKRLHTFVGHTKGVACVRLAPRYGHLAASGGLDGTLRVWRIAPDVEMMCAVRTCYGHSKPLRDVCWSQDARQLLTCSYDGFVKLWDTETGRVVAAVNDGKVPYCAQLHPESQGECLAGTSEKRVVQWDLRAGQRVQEYEPHLGAVNTVLYIDGNRRFVSSSDDKSLRIWDYGIPVPIKYISEPDMHSMPSLALHPSGEFFAAQSLDNQVVVYEATGRFRMQKKRFAGHVVSGYACQVGFSPDGRYVASGDADGRLWLWDWKTSKILKTLKCHDPVCIGCQWHPIEPSRVVTCGWDGKVCLWD